MNYNDVIINYRVIFEDVITPPRALVLARWGSVLAQFWLSFGSIWLNFGSVWLVLVQFGPDDADFGLVWLKFGAQIWLSFACSNRDLNSPI